MPSPCRASRTPRAVRRPSSSRWGFPTSSFRSFARADRSLSDPVYGVHKWWARRPRAVVRALILAAHLPADTDITRFWELFAEDGPVIAGSHVGDPFSGGGTTLVEGSRLGADVSGSDVDPLAVHIAVDELSAADGDVIASAGEDLLQYLREEFEELYPADEDGRVPLHYFRLRRVGCPACQHEALLYRMPLLARDCGRLGAVVRDGKQVAVCPECLKVRSVGKDARSFVCCHRRYQLDEGSFSGGRFNCPVCSTASSLVELQVARAPEQLVAVESTQKGAHRQILAPADLDFEALVRARLLRSNARGLPERSLAGVDGGRPHSYGFETVGDLFGDRQAVVLRAAFDWLRKAEVEPAVATKLELAVSNAISSNNRLCGYATDYGRLAPVFTGIRSYSLPILSVELNPLHSGAGRGTLEATLRRLRRGSSTSVRRRVRVRGSIEEREMAAGRSVRHAVLCKSAEDWQVGPLGRYSAIVTDPPYYDFIAYSDLSLLHRDWLAPNGQAELGGSPIFPLGESGQADFVERLGRSLRRAAKSLEPGGVVVFTYHSAHETAWRALRESVESAELFVSALFPVWADARSSGAHGHPGSCEFDLVWVCRPEIVARPDIPASADDWLEALEEVGMADRTNLELGLKAATDSNEAMRVKRCL